MRNIAALSILPILGFLAAVLGCTTTDSVSDSGNRRGGPRVGDLAPDFSLSVLNEEGRQVTLSSFAGRKPVVLIFGSYT